jgi:uncharacterized protein YceH (UPF0502 family)
MDVTDAEPTDLSAEEVRVLGCLVEKEATTPANYPLTLNALRSACNQSTSRDPVVSYDDRTVEAALASLRRRGFTRNVHSTSNRAMKFRHVLPDVLALDPAETAVLCVLMLRGPQTVGELKGRTERQHGFASIEETAAVLDALAGRARPLVRRLPRSPGQKDARWIQLLSPPAPVDPGADAEEEEGEVAGADDAAGTDPYGAATAEFYELLATAHWERTGLELLDLLDGVDPAAGPIVDVGSGTGIGLPYLLAAVPGAEIVAIEPSKAMRTALHTRLVLDPSLRGRVTVDPRPLAQALPPTASAVLLSAVIGHLTEDECAALWRFVAERMPADAPAIVELLPPHRPVEVDDRVMRWTMTYRVVDGHTVVAEHAVTSDYRCWSPDDVRDAVVPHGLTMTEHGDAVVVRR